MPDIVIRQIDDAMVERIKQIARDRKWSINDVALHAMRNGLGLSQENLSAEREFRSIATLGGTWRAEESAAFEEAVDALASVPEGQLAPRRVDSQK